MNLRAFVVVTSLAFAACGFAEPATSPSAGLDSLSDEKLMNELATRGLSNLLDHAFEVNHVPLAEQESRRAILALQTLSDPTKKVSAQQRQQLLNKIAAGIEQMLPTMHDPEALLTQAKVLVDQGESRDVNTLEYWGENLSVMSQLRPIALAVGKMFDRAAELAQQEVNAKAANVNPANTTLMAQLDKLDQLQNLATYSARMNDYAIALSLDPSDPQRKDVADGAIKYLKDLDTEDQPVRAVVHIRIAKLNMVKGDYATARSLFDEMLKPGFKPAPAVGQIYEAKYFRAVTEVLDKKPDAAKKAMSDLANWQQTNLPPDKQTQEGAAAALAMLEYRLDSLQADLATDPQAKANFDTTARKVLLKLQADHPEFRAIISDLIIARLPDNASMADLDPLMLDALVRRAVVEVQRPESDNADTKTLQRGADAAAQLVHRTGTDIDPASKENAEFVLGYFQQRLGDKVDSINAFLDYVEHHPGTDRAPIAMQNAEAGIVKAKQSHVDDARLGAAYDRFLPLAINAPYNRKQLAMEYAYRLLKENKPQQAIDYFRQVPPDDKRLLAARFYQMIATKQLFDSLKPGDPQRASALASIQKLADDVNSLAVSSTDPDRQSMIVRTKLLAAELARADQKDPNRAIALLNDFEQAAKGLPNESSLMNEGLLIRVQSLMALGKFNDAAETLQTLLKTQNGGQGAAIVYSLLVKLDADFDKAQQAGNTEEMRKIALNRAALSGNLVQWAKNNSDSRIQKFTYRYSVYEADTKERAAAVETDPAAKSKLYGEALKLYTALDSPENIAAYRETLPPTEQSTARYDPAVKRGLAMVQYDLGDFAKAQQNLAILLKDGRLGSPLMDIERDGQLRTIDNDAYWEAVLKLIRSNLKLGADPDSQRVFLKNLYIRWGDHVGGVKWKDEFAKLKSELIPDFQPPKLDASTTAPASP
jgi:hypothetical protein